MNPKHRPPLWTPLALLVLLVFTLQGVFAQDQPVFRIGVLDDQQGSISTGARLAVNTINDAGGVRGADGTIFQLELVIQPVTDDPTAADAVAALDDANVVAVLGPLTTQQVLDDMDALQSLDVPVIAPTTGDTILMSDSSGMVFRSRAADAQAGQALASYIITDFSLQDIATVQLDVASTISVIGFTNAATALGITPDPALIVEDPTDLTIPLATLLDANPAVVVVYGSPDRAAELYAGLHNGGWQGLFAYDQAFDPIFRGAIPYGTMTGVIAPMTWSFTATDQLSVTFLNAFIRTYGTLPGEIEAASYDSVMLVAQALTLPGSLRDNLIDMTETRGVQGILKSAQDEPNALSSNIAIVRLGTYGAPEVLARYVGGDRLPNVLPEITIPNVTPTPIPTVITATPEGVVLTVTQPVQNVRSGPGDQYEILGQLTLGEQATVIGANLDYSWVVINFRGRQGWLATYLVDITGDLRSVPEIPIPPAPTPNVTATPTTPPTVDVIIDSVVASPTPIIAGQNFTINITVRNIGNSPAGTFAVGGTFPPNNTYLVANVPPLQAGQSVIVPLTGILTQGGTYTTSLTIDVNNQVQEGVVGEQNNIYNFTYTVDHQIIRQASQTLNLGDTIDLEGNNAQGDANWNSDGGVLGLKGIFGARLGVLGGGDFNAINYDLINPSVINRDTIPRTEMAAGTILGILTADGHRGVMQVNGVSDTQITLTFRVYNG